MHKDFIFVEKEKLRRLLKAQGKMLDDWAEFDDVGKQELWRNLHKAGEDLAVDLPRSAGGYRYEGDFTYSNGTVKSELRPGKLS